MLYVQTARHQVAIAGRVTDAVTRKPISGAQVRITEAPITFVERLTTHARNVRFGSPTMDVVRPVLKDLAIMVDAVLAPQANMPDEAKNVAEEIQAAIKGNRIPILADVWKLARAILDKVEKMERDELNIARAIKSTPAVVFNVNAARAIMDRLDAKPEERLAAAQVLLDGLQARQTVVFKRPDQTLTGADGSFYFIDLPDGEYTLTVSLPGTGSRYQAQALASANVTRDTAGTIDKGAPLDISLRPTGFEGNVRDEDDNMVSLAEIRVVGSGEVAYSSVSDNGGGGGAYRLIGLEMGNRTVRVSARGYRTQVEQVTLEQGAMLPMGIILKLSPQP